MHSFRARTVTRIIYLIFLTNITVCVFKNVDGTMNVVYSYRSNINSAEDKNCMLFRAYCIMIRLGHGLNIEIYQHLTLRMSEIPSGKPHYLLIVTFQHYLVSCDRLRITYSLHVSY